MPVGSRRAPGDRRRTAGGRDRGGRPARRRRLAAGPGAPGPLCRSRHRHPDLAGHRTMCCSGPWRPGCRPLSPRPLRWKVLGAIRHAAVAASSFTASGLAVALARRAPRAGRLALSPRETEVLRLLRDGLSVPAIALEMFISLSTAKTYVARLYEKLGAANRAQALMTAMHHGLIRLRSGRSPPGPAAAGGRPGRAGRPTCAAQPVGPVVTPARCRDGLRLPRRVRRLCPPGRPGQCLSGRCHRGQGGGMFVASPGRAERRGGASSRSSAHRCSSAVSRRE